MSEERDDFQESVRLPAQKKYIISFIIGLLAIIVTFALAMWWLDRQAVMRYEQQFNEQQALQTLLAKQGFEDRLAWLATQTEIIASHYLA